MSTPQVVPQQVEQEEALPPNYGEKNEKLPQELQAAILDLVRRMNKREKWPRRMEVIKARRKRHYANGDQHIYWDARAWMFYSVSGGQSVEIGDGGSVDMPHYVNNYDIWGPYQRSIVSVLSQNPVGVVFQPRHGAKAESIASAREAEKFRHEVDRNNPRRDLQSSIVRLMCTDGRVVTWTRTEEDTAFGFDADGGSNFGELITTHGVLESRVPITAKRMSDWPYAFLYDEIDISKAKDRYPDAKIIENASGCNEDTYERYARLGVLSGPKSNLSQGDAYKHLVTRTNVWLRPQLYQEAPEEHRDTLKQIFPSGIHAVFCGDAYCEAVDEAMDDHLKVAFPLPGDGMARVSLMENMLPVQDAFNDLMNLARETHDYGIPATWVAGMDPEALRSQVSEPGVYHPYGTGDSGANLDLRNLIFQEKPATIGAEMLNLLNMLRGEFAQFITGALPALFGGDMKGAGDTASGYAMAREQAMGQMGLPWGALQELYAGIYLQAAKSRAKWVKSHPDDDVVSVTVPGKFGRVVSEEVSISKMAAGEFDCYPDQDSSFPETMAAQRAAFMRLMADATANPILMETMMQPGNQALGKKYIGLEDLEIPGEEARARQLEEIEELLKTSPVPPTPQEIAANQEAQGLAQGLEEGGVPVPPPPQLQPKPSVPVDVEFDIHLYHWQAGQSWWNSPERDKEEAKGNEAGLANVRLHLLEHYQLMRQGVNDPAKALPALAGAPPAPPPTGPAGAAPPVL